MTDNYQAVYDAVRSSIRNADIGRAVEEAFRLANISHYAEMTQRAIQQVAWTYENPSVQYRPRLFIDGNKWCALYGDNLQDGVAGFGDSPELACTDFNVNWRAKLKDQRQANKIAEEERREEARANSQFGVGS